MLKGFSVALSRLFLIKAHVWRCCLKVKLFRMLEMTKQAYFQGFSLKARFLKAFSHQRPCMALSCSWCRPCLKTVVARWSMRSRRGPTCWGCCRCRRCRRWTSSCSCCCSCCCWVGSRENETGDWKDFFFEKLIGFIFVGRFKACDRKAYKFEKFEKRARCKI